jgi:hypothetical protein
MFKGLTKFREVIISQLPSSLSVIQAHPGTYVQHDSSASINYRMLCTLHRNGRMMTRLYRLVTFISLWRFIRSLSVQSGCLEETFNNVLKRRILSYFVIEILSVTNIFNFEQCTINISEENVSNVKRKVAHRYVYIEEMKVYPDLTTSKQSTQSRVIQMIDVEQSAPSNFYSEILSHPTAYYLKNHRRKFFQLIKELQVHQRTPSYVEKRRKRAFRFFRYVLYDCYKNGIITNTCRFYFDSTERNRNFLQRREK